MGRRTIGACLAAALLVATDGGRARAGDPLERLQRGPDFQKRVDAAIAKGVAWLRSTLPKDGRYDDHDKATFGAGPGLTYHALRTCGVSVDDPLAASVFKSMRLQYAGRRISPKDSAKWPLTTSDIGVMCIALADHGEPLKASDAAGERAYRLVESDLAWMAEMVKFLEDTQDARGMWFTFADDRNKGGVVKPDNIETQYALLGLKAASRAGVRAKSATWLRSLQHYVDTQSSKRQTPGRGWGYDRDKPDTDGNGGTPWTTAGGVSAIALCRSELFGDPKYTKASDARAAAAVKDGLAWLGDMFHLVGFSSLDFARRYGTVRLDYDTAYAVERAGDIARVDRMGDHDWFGEGAEWFIAIQSKNGAWGADQPKGRASDVAGPMDAGDVLASTCFALLFLARATPPVLTHALDDTDINFAVAPTLSDKDFADFLDLVLSRWRRIDDSGVKARLFAKTTAVGPRIVALLIKRLSSDKDEDRTAAFALLKHATGLDNGYDPAAKPEARDVAVAAWTSWWTANEKTLHFDAAKGLLIP